LASGLEQAAKGRALSGLPEALRRAMARHGVGSAAFALRQGNPAATAEALKTVADETASRAERLEFLAVLAEVRVPGAVPALSRACRGIVKDDALRQATRTALAAYDDPSIAQGVLSVYPGLGPLSLPTAQALLASRPAWSMAYVQAIARKPSGWAAPPITAQSVPASIVRKIKQHRNGTLQAMAESVWPQTGKATSAELEDQIRERAAWIRAEAGDPYAGRTLFQTSCSGCHRLFAQGGEVGPDLTVHDRTDIVSLLLAILFLVLFGIGWGLYGDNSSPLSLTADPGAKPDGVAPVVLTPPRQLHTLGGLSGLLGQMQTKFGDTTGYRLVIYPDYASLDRPDPGDDRRKLNYYYRGGFDDPTASPKGSDTRAVDLSKFDAQAVIGVLRGAPETIGIKQADVKNTYLIITPGGDPAAPDAVEVMIYVSSDFGSGYVKLAADGSVKQINYP
jgi:mono/diheme cytochrome c family protein